MHLQSTLSKYRNSILGGIEMKNEILSNFETIIILIIILVLIGFYVIAIAMENIVFLAIMGPIIGLFAGVGFLGLFGGKKN